MGLLGGHQEERGVRGGRQVGTGMWSAFSATIVTTAEAGGAQGEALPPPWEPRAVAVRRGLPRPGFSRGVSFSTEQDSEAQPPALGRGHLAPERAPLPACSVQARLCETAQKAPATLQGGRQSTPLNGTFLPRTQ